MLAWCGVVVIAAAGFFQQAHGADPGLQALPVADLDVQRQLSVLVAPWHALGQLLAPGGRHIEIGDMQLVDLAAQPVGRVAIAVAPGAYGAADDGIAAEVRVALAQGLQIRTDGDREQAAGARALLLQTSIF